VLVLAWIGGAILAGLLAGGSLRALSGAKLRGESLMLVLFVIQLVARGPFLHDIGVRGVGAALWLVSTAALAVLAARNFRAQGMLLVCIGMLANLLVVAVNGGMPVGAEAAAMLGGENAREAIVSSGGFYFLSSGNEPLLMLADVVPLPAGRFSSIASLGDFLLFMGAAAFIVATMTRRLPTVAVEPVLEA